MAVVNGKEKLTSGLEDILRFWCQKKLAKEVLSHHKEKCLIRRHSKKWNGVHLWRFHGCFIYGPASRYAAWRALTRCRTGKHPIIVRNIGVVGWL